MQMSIMVIASSNLNIGKRPRHLMEQTVLESALLPISVLPMSGSLAPCVPSTAELRHSPILMVFASTDLPDPGGATKMSHTRGRLRPPDGSYGQMPPSGRRNSTLPLSQGEAVRFQGSMVRASPSRASAGLAVEASARPGALLITPSSGSPTMVVALALPQPSMRCDRVEMRRRSRAGCSTGAQVAKLAASLTLMWFSFSRASRRKAKARRRSALPGNMVRKLAPISFSLHGRLAAALDDDGGAPGYAVLAEGSGQFHERPRVLRTYIHVDAGEGIVAELDALAAMRHGIGVEDLVADRRPQQGFRRRSGLVILGTARHHPVAGQHRLPLGAGHFAVEGSAENPQRFMRLQHRGGTSCARSAESTRAVKAAWRAAMMSLRSVKRWVLPSRPASLAVAAYSALSCLRSSLVSTEVRVQTRR